MSKRSGPLLGGPGTRLPTIVESFLSWSLAVSCLGVSGYHYIRTTVVVSALSFVRARLRKVVTFSVSSTSDGVLPYEKVWVPLMTYSRAELNFSPKERYGQLVQLLQKCQYPINDDGLVVTLRKNGVARRLASLAMRPYSIRKGNSTSGKTTTLLKEHPELDIVRSLARVWPKLLQLPHSNDGEYPYQYQISLVLPAFRENGHDISRKLLYAKNACIDPEKVEIILVDSGECKNLDVVQTEHNGSWGQIKTLAFTSGGGRGPCLNFGANEASGRILTFCHSDTRLPKDWDGSLIKAFDDNARKVKSNACAFSFGIDTSEIGLNGGHHPPGIKAVVTTANLRTHMYALPYGDQCISIPADIFHYLGGFPDQCLMEDYEIVALLRKRAALLPKLEAPGRREQLFIIGGQPALCSPRRWQKFGVLYVTWMNSKFVNVYACGLGPDDLFRLYYGSAPPKRDNALSPWEIQLDKMLQ